MSEPVRLLSLIKGLGPGGAEQLLLSSARVRDRVHFHEEVAYLLPGELTIEPNLRALGLQIHCLRSTHSYDLAWLGRLRSLLEERHFDVVHVHSPYVAGMARLAVRSIPKARRPHVVSTEHNIWSSHAQLSRALNSATFPLGDAWFAVSNEVRSSIPARLRDRVEVVVHGIVLSDVDGLVARRAEVRAELGLHPDQIAVVTIANYRKQKGYPDLFAAARRLRDAGANVRFLVIGQGPLEAEIHALHAQLGLAGFVDVLGYRSDAMQVAAACDLFALASHYEGLPVAIMEAQAVGLPVVATSVGGVPEAVRDGVEGLLVPPHRPDLFADAIQSLARDPQRRAEMSTAATKRARGYDIEMAVCRIEDVYGELSSRRRV